MSPSGWKRTRRNEACVCDSSRGSTHHRRYSGGSCHATSSASIQQKRLIKTARANRLGASGSGHRNIRPNRPHSLCVSTPDSQGLWTQGRQHARAHGFALCGPVHSAVQWLATGNGAAWWSCHHSQVRVPTARAAPGGRCRSPAPFKARK
jgi:hypothetical protein